MRMVFRLGLVKRVLRLVDLRLGVRGGRRAVKRRPREMRIVQAGSMRMAMSILEGIDAEARGVGKPRCRMMLVVLPRVISGPLVEKKTKTMKVCLDH